MEITLKKGDISVSVSSEKTKGGYYIRVVEFAQFPKEVSYIELSYGQTPTEIAKILNKYIEDNFKIALVF